MRSKPAWFTIGPDAVFGSDGSPTAMDWATAATRSTGHEDALPDRTGQAEAFDAIGAHYANDVHASGEAPVSCGD